MNTNSSRPRCYKFSMYLKQVFYGFTTEYETPKIVTIHSTTMTIILRTLQTVFLCYSIFYLFLLGKGYQKQDSSIISSVTLKVKGIGYIHTPDNQSFIFDGSDYIIPPSENNAIFIMTNFIQTEQARSQCLESPSVPQAICTIDSDCQNKSYTTNINGRWTGRCKLSPRVNIFNEINIIKNPTIGLCEIQGWCPVENDRQETTFMKEVVNFTIFIKNFIEFPLFHVKHKNMVDDLKSCVFHPVESKDCPIFRLDYILNQVEKDATERASMLRLGGVIRVKIDWDCNLDRSIKLCRPIYSFARLDTKFQEESFSVGFNFRFASHWKYNKKYLRTLTKAYGLRIIICVSGKAGRFDLITLTLNIGSLVGIFGLAAFLCDIILLNVTRKASIYRNYVYERIHIHDLHSRKVPSSICESQRNADTIFTNTMTNEETFRSSIWTTSPLVKLRDGTCTTSSYTLTNANTLSASKPVLGLTNSVK